MAKIRCICIDDQNKPSVIPQEKWVEKGNWYNISYIFIMVNQGRIQGVELAEFDISMHAPYNCYRLSRFAVLEDDLKKFAELIKDCDDMRQLEDVDIEKLTKQIELIPSE